MSAPRKVRSLQRTLDTWLRGLDFLGGEKSCTPIGVPAISRGLSEATPPVRSREIGSHPGGAPEGCQRVSHSQAKSAIKPCRQSGCDPCGVESELWTRNRGHRCAQPPANRLRPLRGQKWVAGAERCA